jgi:PilZ domain
VFVWRRLVVLEHANALAKAAERRASQRVRSPLRIGAAESGNGPAGTARGNGPGGTARGTGSARAGRGNGSAGAVRGNGAAGAAPAPAAVPQPQQHRRQNVRVEIQRPVIAYVGPDRQDTLTYTLDLSAGGMLVAGLETLETGELFEFELTLDPEEEPIEGVAAVVRTSPEGTCAAQFRSIGSDDERRLVKYVFDAQRGVVQGV